MNQHIIDIIEYAIRLFFINLCVYYSFIKILNNKDADKGKTIVIVLLNLILSLICSYIYDISFFLSIVVLMITFISILGFINKVKLGYSTIVGVISYAICFVFFTLSIIVSFIPYKLMESIHLITEGNQHVNLPILLLIQFVLVWRFFKIKRFKNGFDFLRNKLNNDFTDIVVINISTIIILIYCLIGSCFETYDEKIIRNLFISFIILVITMIATIQKTFTMYYKQKLMKQTLEDYERNLIEKDNEIERLKNDKFNISKITHEFYNRQKALELAVKKVSLNAETAEELGALDRIQDLTNEYSQKLQEMKSLPKLPLTEIPEIDDMFKYMQEECDKNNIEFRLKIVGNIFPLINNIIPKNKLETMIGDHIRDAIIAINSSETKNREIFVILGIKDKKYELCVYDTGIEFEIDTLLKLGLEPITTHKDTGGSGIGFVTTFETLKETKASLIIHENSPEKAKPYTKAVIIRFDNKHQYKICSYRIDEIKKKNNGRKIILENVDSND